MEMDQTQTVAHVFLIQEFQGFKKFGTCQAKLRGVATALLPFTRAAGCQFDADADIRTDIHLFGLTGDNLQLVHLLHHDKDLLTHLLCQQGQLNVTLVLVSVTDDDGVALTLHGDDGMELGFRAGLQSQVELTTMRNDLFNDRLHLVHLDGVDHIVLTFVVVFLTGLLEAAPGLFNPVVKDIGETEQHRGSDIANGQLVHHFAQVNLCTILARGNVHVAFLVDAEIGSAPSVDVVELLRIFNRPFLHKQS